MAMNQSVMNPNQSMMTGLPAAVSADGVDQSEAATATPAQEQPADSEAPEDPSMVITRNSKYITDDMAPAQR